VTAAKCRASRVRASSIPKATSATGYIPPPCPPRAGTAPSAAAPSPRRTSAGRAPGCGWSRSAARRARRRAQSAGGRVSSRRPVAQRPGLTAPSCDGGRPRTLEGGRTRRRALPVRARPARAAERRGPRAPRASPRDDCRRAHADGAGGERPDTTADATCGGSDINASCRAGARYAHLAQSEVWPPVAPRCAYGGRAPRHGGGCRGGRVGCRHDGDRLALSLASAPACVGDGHNHHRSKSAVKRFQKTWARAHGELPCPEECALYRNQGERFVMYQRSGGCRSTTSARSRAAA
jgi:hypothetical protein